MRRILAVGLLSVTAATLRATEVVRLIREMEPCGDTPVFCYGEPGECLGLVNVEGEILRRFAMPFEVYSTFSEGLLAVVHPNSDRAGFLDTSGRWAIKPRFENVRRFFGGLAAARLDGKWGYIDKSGEWAIPPKYDDVMEFDAEGYARVYVGAWGAAERRVAVIDRTGRQVIGPQLFDVTPFSDGFAWAILEAPCVRWGPFERHTPGVSDGFVEYGVDRYRRSGQAEPPRCRWSLIDTTGQRLTEKTYEDVGMFSEGLAPVRNGMFWGFVLPDGTMAIEPQFLGARSFSQGLAAVRKAPEIDWEDPASSHWVQNPGPVLADWGFIDRSGGFAIEPTFTDVEEFREGLARVWNRAPPYFINSRGETVLQGGGYTSGFCHGIAHVILEEPGRDKNRWTNPIHVGYMDRQGKIVFSWKYTLD